MSWRAGAAVLMVAASTASARAAAAEPDNPSALSCQQLWAERNLILKMHGYCFVTAREIAAFGNDGCTIRRESAVPLSASEQNRMALILLNERMKLCR